MHLATKMSTSTRITRSKGESDGLSLPMRMRPTRRDTASGRNRGTALSTSGWEHQQQMSTQMPHLTQSPEAASAERTTTAPMLPPGPHRPLTPHMPLPHRLLLVHVHLHSCSRRTGTARPQMKSQK